MKYIRLVFFCKQDDVFKTGPSDGSKGGKKALTTAQTPSSTGGGGVGMNSTGSSVADDFEVEGDVAQPDIMVYVILGDSLSLHIMYVMLD